MAFDFKKEYKEIYLPDKKPDIILVPKMNYKCIVEPEESIMFDNKVD